MDEALKAVFPALSVEERNEIINFQDPDDYFGQQFSRQVSSVYDQIKKRR